MNLVLLYLLLVKATLTSFSGMTSLAVIRQDLVLNHGVLTDEQLNTAIAAGRLSPGPNGTYIVGLGYFLGGYPGAAVGGLALITPSFLSIAILRLLRSQTEKAQFRRAIDSVLLASAGLTLANAIPMAQDAIGDWKAACLAIAALGLMLFSKIDSFYIVLGSAVVALLYST